MCPSTESGRPLNDSPVPWTADLSSTIDQIDLIQQHVIPPYFGSFPSTPASFSVSFSFDCGFLALFFFFFVLFLLQRLQSKQCLASCFNQIKLEKIDTSSLIKFLIFGLITFAPQSIVCRNLRIPFYILLLDHFHIHYHNHHRQYYLVYFFFLVRLHLLFHFILKKRRVRKHLYPFSSACWMLAITYRNRCGRIRKSSSINF